MQVREVIEVRAPLEEAFGYVADFSSAAEWDPAIVQSRRVNNGPPSAGATYDVIAVYRGTRVPFRYEVKEYEPNRRILLVGEGAKARSRDEIVFEPDGEGTRIVYDASLELKGVYRFARRLVGGEFRRICSRALAGLKARLDASR